MGESVEQAKKTPPALSGACDTEGDDNMSIYTAEELAEARRSIDSTLHKCEKALLKLTPGKSQHTLTARRIKAFQIALALIDRELEAGNDS